MLDLLVSRAFVRGCVWNTIWNQIPTLVSSVKFLNPVLAVSLNLMSNYFSSGWHALLLWEVCLNERIDVNAGKLQVFQAWGQRQHAVLEKP